MNNVQEPTVRKTLTVATSRMPWRLVIGLVAGIVVMSIVVVSGQELKHVPPASPSFTVLHSFDLADGAHPVAGLTRDAAGNLYGTAGVVFKLGPTGTYTVLYRFTGGADGGAPNGPLIRDPAGNLYGTTTYGGSGGTYGHGVVFKLSPTGTETVLYRFTGGADGGAPNGPLIRDPAGNLYGTTAGGGATTNACKPPFTCGVVFELIRCDSTPSGYDFKVLHSFTGPDGALPLVGLIRDGAGNLYGTTANGGDTSTSACSGLGCGVVFKLSPTGTETVLYSFTGGADGAQPLAGLIRDAGGNLYTTTSQDGTGRFGTVFKLSPAGAGTALYSFSGGADGGNPSGGLTRDSAGNLYGTTVLGGVAESVGCSFAGSTSCGVVFKLSPTGTYTVLHTFTGGGDGGNPFAGLILDVAGNLYGTTYFGGRTRACDGCGVVFRVTR
jgi:uncharacterized repeat protein (TIGR03803 family)